LPTSQAIDSDPLRRKNNWF